VRTALALALALAMAMALVVMVMVLRHSKQLRRTKAALVESKVSAPTNRS
jgi:hypothetical protein